MGIRSGSSGFFVFGALLAAIVGLSLVVLDGGLDDEQTMVVLALVGALTLLVRWFTQIEGKQ